MNTMEPIYVPINRGIVSIRHPANNEPFLHLPANDIQPSEPPSEPPISGIHHLTALTACFVLTSYPGFLSSSRDRDNAEGVISVDLDAILVLESYYFHLTVPQPDPLYPICLEFQLWTFPHNKIPKAWQIAVPPDSLTTCNPDSWSVISAAIKARDKWRCRVSGWRDGLTMTYIVPVSEAEWLQDNEMNVYVLENKIKVENDSRNVFALRWDLHSMFDQAKWVIVPKGGEMVVHFIGQSFEAIALYHNQKFDTTYLSHEFIFARFAWAIMKKARLDLDMRPWLWKRFRWIGSISDIEPMVTEPDMDGDVVSSDDSAPPVDEAEELEKDLTLAKRIAPFFFEEPDATRTPYHTMMWYPGRSIMERKKREYIDAHPNIRAQSAACLSASSDDSDMKEED